MSGHSHWAGIKHKKEVTDQKRGKVFSKLLAAVSAAAKSEPNPNFNPRLRTAIVKAKEASVPQENIERAVARATEADGNLEELVFEAYGPGGAAILVTAVSDNRNRTVQEIKIILKEHGGKWAETGSVRWAFEEMREEGVARTGLKNQKNVGKSGGEIVGKMTFEIDSRTGGMHSEKAGTKEMGMGETGGDGELVWRAKFPQELSEEDAKKLAGLVAMLHKNNDVQKVFTSAK